MTDFNLEVVEFQLASEIEVLSTGQALFSFRAVARLIGVSPSTLIESLKTDDRKLPSKLAQFVIAQGFEADRINSLGTTKIPDLVVASILEYYAFEAGKRCTEQARAVYRVFARIGIRAYAQQLAGWKSEESLTYDEAVHRLVQDQIPAEPSEWEVRFIPDFWSNLTRLYGLERGDNGCAQMISAHVYNYFPIEVRQRLDEINPIQENGYRKHRQHQHFDKELLALLKNHIRTVLTHMEGADTKADFLRAMKRVKRIRFNTSNVHYLDSKRAAIKG